MKTIINGFWNPCRRDGGTGLFCFHICNYLNRETSILVKDVNPGTFISG